MIVIQWPLGVNLSGRILGVRERVRAEIGVGILPGRVSKEAVDDVESWWGFACLRRPKLDQTYICGRH